MSWSNAIGSSSGGGDGDVGKPGKSMSMLPFDAKTRPITRRDLYKFGMEEGNLSDHEKDIITKSFVYGITGTLAGGFVGYTLSGYLPFRWLEKKAIIPFKGFARFGRICFAISGASFPFLYVQQWCMTEVLKLDEQQSVFAFHIKRLLITQRSSLIFTRGQVREVTKEEQQRLSSQNITIRQQESRAVGGSGSSVNVDLVMQQQVLTPVAQTGYKQM